jgi:hypothetical protein
MRLEASGAQFFDSEGILVILKVLSQFLGVVNKLLRKYLRLCVEFLASLA